MASFDHPVYLTRSAPFDASSGRLAFYNVIEPDVVSRSSVLSCVAEAGGEAKLPESVTVSDFTKWLAAVTGSPARLQRRSFTHLCTVIKVADAVDDKHLEDWVNMAAKTLIQGTLPSTAKEEEAKILDGLSLLTEELQHRVFKAAAFDAADLNRLLNLLPTQLHSAVLAAMITPEKMLRMPLSDALLPAFQALACLPASQPSVLSLRIKYEHVRLGQNTSQQEVLSHLAQALRHHIELTSLLLPAPSAYPQECMLLFQAIATLTALQSLQLSGAFSFPPDHAPILKQTLRALPQLHNLEMSLYQSSVPSTKRQRDEEAPSQPQCCLADMLSPATALTSLSLSASDNTFRPHQNYFTAVAALPLPHLVQLTALFGDDVSLAASFFQNLSAPLTSLQLTRGRPRPPRAGYFVAPAAQQLLDSLAAFPQLQNFRLVLPTDDLVRSPNASSVVDAISSALPVTLAAFRQLESFSLAAEPAVVHRSITLLATATTAMTQLNLGIYHQYGDSFRFRNHAERWREFFDVLCEWRLQHLDIDCQWDALSGGHRYPPDDGVASLAPLTQLTLLSVSGWKCVHGPADGEALAGMTLLQHLCIDHTADDFELPRDCIASLRALSALTSLTLRSSYMNDRLVPDLTVHVPPTALPALQQLTLSFIDSDTADSLAAYAAALPALSRLTVHFLRHILFEDLSEDDEQDCETRDSMIEELAKAEARLLTAAASAGVSLVIDRQDLDDYLYEH